MNMDRRDIDETGRGRKGVWPLPGGAWAVLISDHLPVDRLSDL